MKVGDTISATVNGETLVLTLDEHVPYEPACYHWDDGLWAFDENESEYFVSQDGTVYAEDSEIPPNALRSFTRPIGKVRPA